MASASAGATLIPATVAGAVAPRDHAAVLVATSVPLSLLGARIALRADPERLERIYGVVPAGLGAAFLLTQ